MLDFARSSPPAVGTNLKGDQADTSWLFLLPTLELPRVVVLGSIPPATLAAIDALAGELEVLSGSRRQPRGPGAAAPGLVYVGPARGAELTAVEDAREMLAGMRASGGVIYLAPGRGGSDRAARLAERLGAGATVRFGTGAPAGRAPAATVSGAAWVIPASSLSPTGARRQLARARRLLQRARRRALRLGPPRAADPVSEVDTALRVVSSESGVRRQGIAPGHGVLLRPGTGELPDYVREVAGRGGVELDSQEWSLAPPRGYRSQKVIFFTRTPDGSRCVVKLTQDPRYNRLLTNEARALALLEGRAGPPLALPRLLFESSHAGLAVIGQTALPGRPFPSVSTADAGCPAARAAVEAVTALSERTAARPDAASGGAGAALAELLGRYEELYTPAERVRGFLADCVEQLDGLSEALPCVFMHADTTVFNILVGEDLEIGLVDWENAEPQGMPLWDLVHFLQTYGAWSAQRDGTRYTPAIFRRQLLGDSELAELLRGAARSYAAALKLPDGSLEPLFHTCWMQQAVRQARQLRRSQLHRGLYHEILATSVDAALEGEWRL